MELKKIARITQIESEEFQAAIETGLLFLPYAHKRGDSLFIVEVRKGILTGNSITIRVTSVERVLSECSYMIRFIYPIEGVTNNGIRYK